MPTFEVEQIFRYDGPETPVEVTTFIDTVSADPMPMLAALRLIDQAPVPLDELQNLLSSEPETLKLTATAFGVAQALLAKKADRGFDFGYPRPVEKQISGDKRGQELIRQHRARAANGAAQQEISYKIRARQLAIAIGFLPTKQTVRH